LALASGVLATLSGCTSMCDSGPMFPRLFDRSSSYGMRSSAECECHNSYMAPMPTMISSQGTMTTMPSSATSIPITNIPQGQPPMLFKNAAPTPYVP
jgi:hypothetical protein